MIYITWHEIKLELNKREDIELARDQSLDFNEAMSVK